MRTGIASFEVTTQSGGPALPNMTGNPVLIRAYSMIIKELFEIAIEDIGHLKTVLPGNGFNFRFKIMHGAPLLTKRAVT